MKDQNQLKPPSKKRVRTRVTYTVQVEVVDQNNKRIEEQCRRLVQTINPVDKAGFEKAFELVEIARIAKQEEVDQEHQQELQRYKQAKLDASLSFPEKILAYLFGGPVA